MRSSVEEIRLGALYKFGARRGLDREHLVRLLAMRCRLSEPQATLVAGHWLTTEPYRIKAKEKRS